MTGHSRGGHTLGDPAVRWPVAEFGSYRMAFNASLFTTRRPEQSATTPASRLDEYGDVGIRMPAPPLTRLYAGGGDEVISQQAGRFSSLISSGEFGSPVPISTFAGDQSLIIFLTMRAA